MKRIELPLPELMGIAVTRAILGAGLALLAFDRVESRQRRTLGIVLTAIGVLSTPPFVWDLFHKRHR